MTKKQKGVTNWPKLRNNARLADGSFVAPYTHRFTANLVHRVKCSNGATYTIDGYFISGKLVYQDITHLNKKLTPAGIAHKEAGWPYGLPKKGFEQ